MLKTLLSIFRGKGGFCDNPDTEQFKAAFKYVVAHELSVQSDASNCKYDSDTVLLNISNVAMARYVKPVHTDVEMLQTADVAMVTTALSSLLTRSVGAYLAVYIVSKIPVDTCQDCSHQLILPKLVCV